jgi:WD40 repeat protein
MTSSHVSNTFRLFISSTFSDFTAEREALQKSVFPELEKFCAERGARFQAIDLRWGITEEAQQEHDTLRICLEEVRRCQALSPRPNFAVLLGDRYGWEPVPARIPMGHWERLLAAASGVDGKTIRGGYQGPDLNAVPPVMHLRKREGDWAASEAREATLRDALRRAADQAGFTGDDRLPYFASATHQEISLGALDTKDEEGNALHPEEHVNVYVRRIEGLPSEASARAFIDWDMQRQVPVQGARRKLAELELQLRERLPGKVHDIQARWNGDSTDGSHLDTFCAQFLADQQAIIERELSIRQKLPDSEARNARHLSFAKERARNFAGRKPVLRRIAAYLGRRRKTPPLIVHGSGGTGKSALMARAYLSSMEGALDVTVRLARFIGGVPGTESLMTLLIELTADIAAAYDRPAPPAPESMKAARQAFEETLRGSTAERPLVLFLDALDQLDRADGALLLEWLPKELSEHTRIVASTRDGQTLFSAQRLFPKSLLEVPVMTPAEGRQMLDAWLADTREAHYNAGIAPARGRSLTQPQREQVLGIFEKNGKALWLKLAYEEARNWASWDETKAPPSTVEAMVEDLITRRLLEGENHPHVFATRALAYLTAGRFGLSEEELDQALATDTEVIAEFDEQNAKTGQKWEPDEKRPRLPPILWSRLYFDLQSYLAAAQMDGTTVYRWFHREFKEEVSKRFLSDSISRRTTHGHLAATLFALAPYGDDLFLYTDASGTQQPAALRRVMEQPWQLMQATEQEDLRKILTDFGFCLGKCAANLSVGLSEDYLYVQIDDEKKVDEFIDWRSILISRSNLLRRGTKDWPSHRIFFQLSTELPKDSPLGEAAEKWSELGLRNWILARLCDKSSTIDCELLSVISNDEGEFGEVLMLPDKRLLSYTSWPSTQDIKFWSISDGRLLECISHGLKMELRGIELISQNFVVFWNDNGILNLIDLREGAIVCEVDAHKDDIFGVCALSDLQFVTWSKDKTIRIWMREEKQIQCMHVLHGHTQGVSGVLILSLKNILSWSSDGTLRIWDIQTGEQAAMIKICNPWEPGSGRLEGVALLGDRLIASWSSQMEINEISIWDYSKGVAVAKFAEHKGPIRGVRPISDNIFISWAEESRLIVSDVESGTSTLICETNSGEISGAYVVSERHILIWTREKTIHLWDICTGEEKWSIKDNHQISGIDLIGDGHIVTWSGSWSDVGQIRLRSLTTGALSKALNGHKAGIVKFQKLSERTFITVSEDCTIRYWQTPKDLGHSPETLSTHTGVVTALLSQPDFIAVGFSTGIIQFWDTDRKKIRIEVSHGSRISGLVALSINEIIAFDWNGGIIIWDATTGNSKKIMNHQDCVIGVKLLRTSEILSWSWDRTIRLWNRDTGDLKAILVGHSARVLMAHSSDCGLIVSLDNRGIVNLWNCENAPRILEMASDAKNILQGAGDIFIVDRISGISIWNVKLLSESFFFKDAEFIDLSSNHLIYRRNTGTIVVWSIPNQKTEAEIKFEHNSVDGAEILDGGELAIWNQDNLFIYNIAGEQECNMFKMPWPINMPFGSAMVKSHKFAGFDRYKKYWTTGRYEYLGARLNVTSSGRQINSGLADCVVFLDPESGSSFRWYEEDATYLGATGDFLLISSGAKLNFVEIVPVHDGRAELHFR